MKHLREPGGWWCALCMAAAEPLWLGRADEIAYHRFGSPPFVARHALTPVVYCAPDGGEAARVAAAG